MADDEYLKEFLLGPVRENERSYFEGKAGRNIVSFVREMKNSPRVTMQHINHFFDMAAAFSGLHQGIAWGQSQDVDLDHDALVEGSYINRAAIMLSPAPRYDKNLFTIEHLAASASATGMLAVVRPYPIQWHLEHINERSELRKGSFDTQNDRFRLHNNIIMMMLQVIEEEHYTGEMPYVPFILPEPNGVLLGHTMAVRPGADGNRIFIAAAKDRDALKLGRYAHFPQLEATVRTFLGPDEMTPGMKQLRLQLMKYYGPTYKDALSMGMDAYVYAEGSSLYETNPRRDRFEDALIGISDIMASPLWRKNVRLPAHLRGGKGLIIDHP